MNEKEILQTYKQSLELPSKKPEKQIIVCPIGVVASGKTTVIKPLSKKLSLLRISTDDIRKLLKEHGHSYDSVKDLAFRLIAQYIDEGFSIAVDGDCNSQEAQEKIKELKKAGGVKVFWIHINPPEKFIINKLQNYKHTWLFANAQQAIENYKQSKSRHENLSFPFIYIFDPSQENLKIQVEEAVSLIRKELAE